MAPSLADATELYLTLQAGFVQLIFSGYFQDLQRTVQAHLMFMSVVWSIGHAQPLLIKQIQGNKKKVSKMYCQLDLDLY